MATISEAIQIALGHHQAGRLGEAEHIYRQVLAADPRHAGALHLLGLIGFQLQRYDVAESYISSAIRVDGSQPAFHANLAETYRAQGRLDDARRCYEQALRLQPSPEAQNNLGTIWQAMGKLPEAIACYRQALAARPDYADALNNLGTACQEQGDWAGAVESYGRAVAAKPDYARGHYNQGVALATLERDEQARAAYERAVQLDPSYAAAYYGLAMLHQRQKAWSESLAAYERALALRSQWPQVLCSLGTLHQAQGNLGEAIARYQQALAVDPGFAEAWYNWGTALREQESLVEAVEKYRQAIRCKPSLADAHYNLGTVLQLQGDLEGAAAAYRQAIELRPEFPMAHNNLGNVYKSLARPADAVACYERAIALQPEHVEAHNNLGSMRQQQGDMAATMEHFRRALSANPQCAEAYNNLGTVWQELGDDEQALSNYDHSIRLRPDFVEARHNRALVLLSQQRLAEGWPDFMLRRQVKGFPVRHFAAPKWDGGPLADKTLLVHAEQGFGDTFQFLRFIQPLRRLSERLILEVQPQLVPLLRCSGYHETVAAGEPLAEYTLHVPLLDLPFLFGTTLETLPAPREYLRPDPGLLDRWQQRLAEFDGLKVGLHWQGNKAYSNDRSRSIPLTEFAPLLQLPGIQFFSLQKGVGSEQLADSGFSERIFNLAEELDLSGGAFMDTAAVMRLLDLVITSDTATAHLAGALGSNVWVALSAVPDWRWFRKRDDSPWYPSMRLFRQRQAGQWQVPFQDITQALAAYARGEKD